MKAISRVLVFSIAASVTASVDAFQIRTRYVAWNGTAFAPICSDTLRVQSGVPMRIRIQFGVFDDSNGPAPAGGFIGWNIGTITITGGTNTHTPGCLSPFHVGPCSPIDSCCHPDPFTMLSQIDATLGTQSPVWACTAPPGQVPMPQPPPVIRGRNAYVSVFEFTTVPGATNYTVTFSGNEVVASGWGVIGTPTPPDCGNPSIPGDDIPGSVTYAPQALPPVPFTGSTLHLTIVSSLPDCNANLINDDLECGPPWVNRLYSLTGPADGIGWSWSIASPTFGTVSDLNVSGVAPGGTSLQLSQHFADSINAQSCPDALVFAMAFQTAGTTYLAIRVTGTAMPTLCVGPFGGPPNACCPMFLVNSCTFNPTMAEVPISGQDCNGNGQDDTIDILSGVSTDLNHDGIPDECQCAPDFNHDGLLNSQDFFDFNTAFFAGAPSADFNNDGHINSQDFFDFLTAFFAGCH